MVQLLLPSAVACCDLLYLTGKIAEILYKREKKVLEAALGESVSEGECV